MKIEFRVEDDFPPKKDGAQSMWQKALETQRLIKLRLAARAAFGSLPPFEKPVSLSLEIYIGRVNNGGVGDLDNFVTGVCDGLQAAHMRSKLHDSWSEKSLEAIHPTKIIGFEDDNNVFKIQARKILGDSATPWYRVILEEL